jgi:hypothetical protein
MPTITWEWKISPMTVLAGLQLLGIIVAIIGGFYKMQADKDAQAATIAQLRDNVTTEQTLLYAQGDRLTRVETKVDMMLPTIQEIQSILTKEHPPK